MRLLEDHFYKWDEVVIGGNLNAFFYARQKSCHVLPNTLDSPFSHDKTGAIAHLGLNDLDVWQKLSYSLALDGLNPLSGKIKTIRVDRDDKIITVNVGTPNLIKISYNKLHVFDYEWTFGLPDAGLEIKNFRVLDWFDVRSGMKHDLEFIEDDNNFVKKIHFYLSERIDGNTMYKDLVSESVLSKDQLHHPDYSDSLSRLKTIAMMKEGGIKGTSNGATQHLPIKIELYRREVVPNKSFDFVRQGDIIVDNRTGEQLINEWISSRRNSASGRSAT